MNNRFELADVTQILGEFASEIMRHSPGTLFHMLRKSDLSMPQLVTLLFVRRCGVASVSSIGEHLNLSLGATSHLVDRLVVGGFLERAEDQNDRRQKQITLSGAGRALVEEIDQARVEDMARRLAVLPQPALDALMTAMSETVRHLRAAEGRGPSTTCNRETATSSADEQ